jgi:hypothetical protein
MDEIQRGDDLPEVVPVTPDAVKPAPRACPLCGGKFARIGRASGEDSGVCYVPRENEKPATGWIQFFPSRNLPVQAVRVCLECGFVGLFTNEAALENLRERYG